MNQRILTEFLLVELRYERDELRAKLKKAKEELEQLNKLKATQAVSLKRKR